MQPGSVARHAPPLPQLTTCHAHVCKHMYMYICICICVYIHICTYTYIIYAYSVWSVCSQVVSLGTHLHSLNQHQAACMRANICIYIYMYMYMKYIHIYIPTYIIYAYNVWSVCSQVVSLDTHLRSLNQHQAACARVTSR